jgi:hypothetical protein
MAEDYLLPTRRAVLPVLKAFVPLLELVPATSIHPSTVPASRTHPFTRYGNATAAPFRASGLDSSSMRFSVQGFAKPLMRGSQMLETAEDQALKIGSAIKDALDGQTILIDDGMKVRVQWISSSPKADPTESEVWMTTVTFSAEVAG